MNFQMMDLIESLDGLLFKEPKVLKMSNLDILLFLAIFSKTV